jgi:hypothetical protein
MKGIDFAHEIQHAISPEEQVEDVAFMIDSIAEGRKRGVGAMEANYFFGATVICVLLDPLKPDDYKAQAQQMRRQFKGIKDDLNLQIAFRDSLSQKLLSISTIEEALQENFEELFRPASVFSFA